ncbi:hypothetical protein EV426DRAFT_709890 [Tirmania nivea]|nr:hypothetical protein EV426DRAFT_709890 [Tirmania nivea]
MSRQLMVLMMCAERICSSAGKSWKERVGALVDDTERGVGRIKHAAPPTASSSRETKVKPGKEEHENEYGGGEADVAVERGKMTINRGREDQGGVPAGKTGQFSDKGGDFDGVGGAVGG